MSGGGRGGEGPSADECPPSFTGTAADRRGGGRRWRWRWWRRISERRPNIEFHFCFFPPAGLYLPDSRVVGAGKFSTIVIVIVKDPVCRQICESQSINPPADLPRGKRRPNCTFFFFFFFFDKRIKVGSKHASALDPGPAWRWRPIASVPCRPMP